MVIVYKKLNKETNISYKDFDFIFEKFDEFLKKKFTIPPIRKVFKLCLVDAQYSDIKYLKDNTFPDFIEFTVFAKEEILISLGLIIKLKSPYEELLSYLEDYPHYLSSSLVKKLYFNTNNPIEILEELKYSPEIKGDDLAKYFIFDKKIYPTDIICSILTYKKNLDGFFKYNNKHPIKYISELIEALGEQYAYYSVRKCVQKVYYAKLDYLKGNSTQLNKSLTSLLSVIDVHELTFLYTIMYSYQGTNLYILLNLLERREKNVSIFYREILVNQIKCDNVRNS